MANSFASLSVALTWGSILLAVVAFVVGFAWMRIGIDRAVQEAKKVAEIEAQKEAKRCADAYIGAWLTEHAPAIVRQHVENLIDTTMGVGSDSDAAEEIGKAAG